MSTPVATIRLRKAYSGFLLDVDVELGPGITAIFGPSGSGKTTVLNCIAGLTPPDAGEVVLGGRTLFSSVGKVRVGPEHRRLGYVFQDALLFPHLNVRDNILFGYRRTAPALRRIDPWGLAELLDLSPLLERDVATLSGGEAQRVALARAVATSPEVLLLDEPLAALDGALRGRILRYLRTLHRELGIPMAYVSHSLSDVLFLADQVIVLSKGAVIAQGEPYQLLREREVTPLVGLLSLENLIEVEVVGHQPHTGLTEVRAGTAQSLWVPLLDRAIGGRLTIAIRAADILIATRMPEHLSARNVVRGAIRTLDNVGDAVLVTADAGVRLLAEVTQGARESLGLKPGMEVFLIVKSSSIWALD